MDNFPYWQKQDNNSPLFPDIEWQKPEQRTHAGKLLVIGGHSGSFAAVAQAYQDAIKTGIGECRVMLPNSFKNQIDHSLSDCYFVPTNPSGGVNKESLPQLKSAASWADTILYIGDAGRNSETAIVYEQLLHAFPDKTTVIARDALDLLKSNWTDLIDNPRVTLIVTFSQLQKIFQSVYYPKTLLFSMPITSIVEILHKFTITYSTTIILFHNNQLIASNNGDVTTTPYSQPMKIWRGTTAARVSVYITWFPNQKIQASTTAFLEE